VPERRDSCQKLTRPGSGPAAELPRQLTSVAASRRLQIASAGRAFWARQPSRRDGFGDAETGRAAQATTVGRMKSGAS